VSLEKASPIILEVIHFWIQIYEFLKDS